MASGFDITQQVQIDPVEGEYKVPVLPTAHVVIVYSPDAGEFAEGLAGRLRNETPKPYEVINHNVSTDISDEELFGDIRKSLKVLIIFSM